MDLTQWSESKWFIQAYKQKLKDQYIQTWNGVR